jgi:hypothetical protein
MKITARTHGTGKVYDANGLEWKFLRWVDTETGEAEQYVLDENGQKQLDASMKGVLTQIVQIPKPILWAPTHGDGRAFINALGT